MAGKKSVLITGCSDGGIGSALASAMQKRDFHVFATARNLSKMSDLAGLPNVTFLKLDVTINDDITGAVRAVNEATGGTLDYLISNAGHNHFMPILDDDINTLKGLFEINVWGPLALTQAFAPLLIKTRGVMAYVTSVSGYLNVPFMGERHLLTRDRSNSVKGHTLPPNAALNLSQRHCGWRWHHLA